MESVIKKLLIALILIGLMFLCTKVYATDDTDNAVSNEGTKDSASFDAGYKGNSLVDTSIKYVPTINSEEVTELKAGTSYEVVEVLNKWCYIRTSDNEGWTLISKVYNESQSSTSNVTSEENETVTENITQEDADEVNNAIQNSASQVNATKYVSTETLNLRESASTSSKILEQLSMNAQVSISGTEGDWSKITVNGKTGYVLSKYLSDTKTETSSRSESVDRSETTVSSTTESASLTNNGVSGEDIVAFAKNYLGYNYVSGGSSPETGFDCSGFTKYVYAHFGYSLNRVSGDQASNGREVSKDELKPGDLVLFKGYSGSSIGHVGIYIGNNQFIHASNPSSGVKITSMSDSYYKARYVTARRII